MTAGNAHDDALLSVRDLRTHIDTGDGRLHAVDGVSFDVAAGETVCLVGESGSGKSVTCESITGLVPSPPVNVVGGSATFDGESLLGRSDRELRAVRGTRIAHVFQNPQRALDPVYTVGEQVAEPVAIHGTQNGETPRDRAVDLLRRVGIPRASERADDYPHEFSGGMQQRVAIAIALAADPDLVIADEPTTAVDVTVQARLIDLFRELTDDETALLLVTHDLRVTASLADRVLVMYGGTILERGPVGDVFSMPAHPYTQALFGSYGERQESTDPRPARGDVPTDGCRFRGECPHAVDACTGGDQPAFHPVEDDPAHAASCVHYAPDGDSSSIRAAAAASSPTGSESPSDASLSPDPTRSDDSRPGVDTDE
ncbi:ABC transporter ATP-binding protein [Halorubrum tibetense]|uniref:Nickel import system ATP-binding protein NikD n=1 Tax=Halorubrum tibetense TaxID=175631 RepID=A0ABD5S8P6_9EURY